MLEPLAGRLKWERTSYGIRVEIPARVGPMAGLLGPLIGIGMAGFAFRYLSRTEMAPSGEARLVHSWIGIGICAGAICALGSWLLRILTARTVLTLDPTETRIQRRILGFDWQTRSFSTVGLSDLEYIPPPRIWSEQKDSDPVTSEIQFHAGDRTHSFAAGVTESEARALIGKMMEVYDFPKFP